MVGRAAAPLAGAPVRAALRRALPLLAVAALAVAAGAVVLVIVVGHGGRAPATLALPTGKALAASGSLTPAAHLFGDTVTARVEAIVDARRLDPARVRLDASFGPYRPVRRIRRLREDLGATTRLRFVVDLHCVTESCLPKPGALKKTQFPPARVRYVGRGAAVAPVSVQWPAVTSQSRLDPFVLQARDPRLPPLWRVNAAPIGGPRYSVGPGSAFWLLVFVAALLVGAAALALRPYLPQPALPFRRAARLGPLERALGAVESARSRGPEEERKALELLAEELRRSGEGDLAWTASSLAWAPGSPELEPTDALAVDVRRVIEEGSNGRAR